MKKLTVAAAAALGLFLSYPFALADNNAQDTLNLVSFQLQAEKWASTKTAKVVISINADLSDARLGSIHAEILANLAKIAANVDWHITQFQRSKGQSGLEQLQVLAQARIPESELAKIRAQAKAVSKPGENYEVAAIQFSPSQAEIEAVRAQLRQDIYNKAKAELGRLNKIYPDENFSLHRIQFNETTTPAPVPQPRIMILAAGANAQPDSLAVSNKITLTAQVELAAKQN